MAKPKSFRKRLEETGEVKVDTLSTFASDQTEKKDEAKVSEQQKALKLQQEQKDKEKEKKEKEQEALKLQQLKDEEALKLQQKQKEQEEKRLDQDQRDEERRLEKQKKEDKRRSTDPKKPFSSILKTSLQEELDNTLTDYRQLIDFNYNKSQFVEDAVRKQLGTLSRKIKEHKK